MNQQDIINKLCHELRLVLQSLKEAADTAGLIGLAGREAHYKQHMERIQRVLNETDHTTL